MGSAEWGAADGEPPLNRAPTVVRFRQAVSFASFRGWQVVGGKVLKSAAVKGWESDARCSSASSLV